MGLGVEGQHKVHLVDYGLCSRFSIGGLHKQYTHDQRLVAVVVIIIIVNDVKDCIVVF